MIRREDFRLVTGQAGHTADWNVPDQLHAVFLRADRAHAEIVALDTGPALAHPGVKAVLTDDDAREAGFAAAEHRQLPGKRRPAIAQTFPSRAREGRVRYVGEPVAMIVAETAAAEDARELIAVDRDLPAVTTFEDAVKDGAPQLHDDVPGNLAFEFESGDAAATEAAFAQASV